MQAFSHPKPPRSIPRPPENRPSPSLGENKAAAFVNPKEGLFQPPPYTTTAPIHCWGPHIFQKIFQKKTRFWRAFSRIRSQFTGTFLPKFKANFQGTEALAKPQKFPKTAILTPPFAWNQPTSAPKATRFVTIQPPEVIQQLFAIT